MRKGDYVRSENLGGLSSLSRGQIGSTGERKAQSAKSIFWVGYLGCVFVCMMYPPPPPPRQPHNLTITLLLLSTFFALSQAQLRQTSYVSATSGQDTPNCGATVDLPCRSLQIAINATGGEGDCLGWSWGLFWERECGVGFGGEEFEVSC